MTIHTRVVLLPQNPGPLELVEVDLPDPSAYQVVVKLHASGICHTQLHLIHRLARDQPMLLGHEATGVVVKTGSKVNHVREGDSVLLTWMRRAGIPTNRHPDYSRLFLKDGSEARGTSIFTWAEHTIVDEQYVVKVESLADEIVTSIIGCAVMTGAGAVEHTAQVKSHESVAVFGVGGVGLSAIAAASIVGANPVIAVDIDGQKLEFAKRFGATHCVDAARADPVSIIRELTIREEGLDPGGEPVGGADYVFDCVAMPQSLEQSLLASRSGQFGVDVGGTTVIVGAANQGADWSMNDIMKHERRIIGSHGGSCVPDRDFIRYLNWFQKGRLKLDEMVTKRYRLEEVNEAVAALEAGQISGRAVLVF